MFDKNYEVYLNGHILCGEFEGVRSFVEDYYYTKESHQDWLEEMKEENTDDTLTEEDYSYEDSVQFYIDDIKAWATPVLDGFEWSGYYFKEVR
jgi:hypothetical protein